MNATETAYRDFADIHELISQFNKGYVLYQAPLDWRPVTVKVKRYTIDLDNPLKSTLTFWTSETGTLMVKIGEHFNRFKTRD